MKNCLFLLFVLCSVHIILASVQHDHGADLEDNEFAEFEDFDDGSETKKEEAGDLLFLFGQSFPTRVSRSPWGMMQHFGLHKTLFCFLHRVISFSVDLLLIVSTLSYCIHCKQCENILKYLKGVVH